MRFTRDRRGQSVVVGTVILFGFLILALASYQAFAVPAQNNQAEFEHSQDVQSDMEDLRASLLDVRDARQDPYQRPVRVSLGTRYNSRLFTVNPPRPEGSLTTQDRGNLSISGANVVNQDFDNTEPLFDREHRTRLLTYRPNYNEYRNPPRTTFEHSLLYNRFEGANQTITGQRTIDGEDRKLSLIAYSGDIDRQGLSATLDPETIDGSTPTIPITNESDGPIEIVLPTHSPAVWNQTLQDEPNVESVTPNESENSVTVELTGEWDLQMARVGYDGGSVDKTPFSNVTRIDDERAVGNVSRTFDVEWLGGDSISIPQNGRELTVLVTDPNTGDPIEDASVDFSYAERAVNGEGPDDFVADDRTSDSGTTTAFFDASEAEIGDEFYLYAAAGDDADRIVGEVVESEFNGFGPVSASNLNANTDGQNQNFQFQLSGSLADGETVRIDLDDAQSRTGPGSNPGSNYQVDYQDATGSSDDGDVNIIASAESAEIEFVASDQIDDGTTVTVSLSGVDVGADGQQTDPYTVTFTRDDSGATASTTFDID